MLSRTAASGVGPGGWGEMAESPMRWLGKVPFGDYTSHNPLWVLDSQPLIHHGCGEQPINGVAATFSLLHLSQMCVRDFVLLAVTSTSLNCLFTKENRTDISLKENLKSTDGGRWEVV